MGQARAVQQLKRTRRPLFLETRGSVWPATVTPILAFSAYAFCVYLLSLAGLAPNFGRGASSLSSLLSMIVGLMISYRSGSSSERWHEGRKIWASVTSASRSLLTTLHLALPPPLAKRSGKVSAAQQAAVNELMGLIVAFSYALKHHLREADPLNDPDFCHLLPKDLLLSFSSTPVISRTISQKAVEDEKFGRVLNVPATLKSPTKAGATKKGGPRNMPLFILRQIQTLLNEFHTSAAPSQGAPGDESPLLETPTWATCLGIIKEMTDLLTQAERIHSTPIPLALAVHVQQMLVLYCLSIPPQLVELLGLWVVPTSAIVAWTFWGVNAAAQQLSDPFGTEANDLPVDRFVNNIHLEYLELVGVGEQSGSAANDAFLTLPAEVGEKKATKAE